MGTMLHSVQLEQPLSSIPRFGTQVPDPPVANTDTTYHGAATMQETVIGGVRSLQIMSSGQGYASIPAISVANVEMTSYGNAPEKMGANSIFVNLANTIANTFTANTLIKDSTNNAFGIVLDYLDLASTTLAGSEYYSKNSNDKC